ncbi:MAG: hypothetical protein MUE68_06890 [Bacteroidetes bacterium]|jgi:hypothetical protein|nr:hypothetical protein [Bacteroidota bacterium]
MRTFTLALLALVGVVAAEAQIKTIHYKKLQECLPTKVFKGFEREKPEGRTQSSMGMSTSEASVEYSQPIKEDLKEGEEPPPQVRMSVKIQDMVGMPYALMMFSGMQEFESESDDGYEKTVIVLEKYRGIEKGRTSDDKSMTTSFGVANRFLVEVEIRHSNDAALLKEVLGSIDLAKLEKLPDAK